MDLSSLLDSLSRPEAYPHPVGAIEIRQTHISVVFLAGPYAYKIRKPVALGFLDFTTLDKRRHDCDEEVRLNRRLAPRVYLGVVPVTRDNGGVRVEGLGDVVEWAVKMERLPEQARLDSWLARGHFSRELIERLAQRIAAFHQQAESGPHVASFGRFEVVAGNARDNLTQSGNQVCVTISRPVFNRLQELNESTLRRLRDTIDGRARRGVPRDTHGDLHLEHVYLFPDRAPPDDLVIIDCIEFNDRYRCADPVADMAFLAMDLKFRGRADLADAFRVAYFRTSGDAEGEALLPFYIAYRAAVRGKVEGITLAEKEVPENERAICLGRSRAHWLLALGELEEPGRRPCLLLVGGLPGTGKSTLSRNLAERAGFDVIRSDVVRKQLAGLAVLDRTSYPFGKELYSPAWNDRTYAECLRRAEAALFEGKRVLVDASFVEEKRRRAFLDAAARLGVPALLLVCQVSVEVVRARLASRQGDASDADWAIYQQVAGIWQELSPATRAAARDIDAGGNADAAARQALACLRELRLTNELHQDEEA